jgi:type IV pilus assembly protein PilQ
LRQGENIKIAVSDNQKGTTMKRVVLKVRLFFVIITAIICFAAGGAKESKSQVNPEVMSSLEQRMQKRISVSFRSTPIDDVVRVMAAQADVDIIKSPKVVGEVTTTLTDIPLSEALTNILAAQGYGYVTTKNMIRIAPLSEINTEDEKLDSRIYRITYADVAEVEKALSKFISKRGSISSNKGTSNIIVTDVESKIKAMDAFVAEIDRITPQVLVEARIYDITCTDRLDLGVQWSAGTNTTFTGGAASDGRLSPFVGGGFDGTISKTADTAGVFRIGWLTSKIDIDVLISAQKEVVNAKLLANPRVLVLDNEQAMIKIISEIPYQELTETSDGGSIGTTNFREVGVSLMVIPHVTRDGMVRLHVSPEFSLQAGQVDVGASQVLSQPIVDRRTADSTLLLVDGQTMVLGGLRKKEVNFQKNKIPLLGDIPVIENIFKFKAEETVFSELVVFVTPWIVERPELKPDEKEAYEHTEFEAPCTQMSEGEQNGECIKCPEQ